MIRPERALFVRTGSGALPDPRGFDLAYAGDEFCERRLPDVRALHEVFGWCRSHGLGLALLTPPATDAGIAAVASLLDRLAAHGPPRAEVVVNDWGVLKLLGSYGGRFRAALGRLRTARYAYLDGFPGPFLDFLVARGVGGLEFDSVELATRASEDLRSRGLRSSVHLPLKYLSCSRFCPLTAFSGSRPRDAIASCGRECERAYGRLKHDLAEEELFLDGNAWLAEVAREPDGDGWPIDRIVRNDVPAGRGG